MTLKELRDELDALLEKGTNPSTPIIVTDDLRGDLCEIEFTPWPQAMYHNKSTGSWRYMHGYTAAPDGFIEQVAVIL